MFLDRQLRVANLLTGTDRRRQRLRSAPGARSTAENGRVRLTGVVASEVERMLARSLATSFNAFSVTNDLRTDAEMRARLDRKGVD